MKLVLHGRAAEQARLDGHLEAARAGHGAALLLRGEPGIGKTSLLASVRASHDGTTLVASGTEAESRLPFAVLHAAVPVRARVAQRGMQGPHFFRGDSFDL